MPRLLSRPAQLQPAGSPRSRRPRRAAAALAAPAAALTAQPPPSPHPPRALRGSPRVTRRYPVSAVGIARDSSTPHWIPRGNRCVGRAAAGRVNWAHGEGSCRPCVGPPACPHPSGGADALGAAEVELGGGGPAAEQRLPGLEVATRSEGTEVHGLIADPGQQRADGRRGPVVVGGERDRPTGRVALVAAVLLEVVVADVIQRLDDLRAGQPRGEQLTGGERAGVVAELGADGVD